MSDLIRVPENQKCPNCAGSFKRVILNSILNVAYRCPKCLTVPSRYYLDIHYHGERVRIFSDKQGKPLDTLPRAVDLLSHIHYEIENHIFDITRYRKSDIKNFLFENRIEYWYQSKLKERTKGNLSRGYTRGLKRYKDKYIPFFKGRDVREIRTYDIRNFYEQLNCRSLKYTKNIMDALRNFFNRLKEDEFIEKDLSFPVITVDRKTPKWIDYDTQLRVLNTIPEEDRAIFTFLAFQGTRPGEARALKVKDINFNSNSILIQRTFSDKQIRERVKSKVVKPRGINPLLVPLLQDLCKDKHPEAFVFINPRTNRPYSESAYWKVWAKVKKTFTKEGLVLDVNSYQATKHSFSSIFVQNGGRVEELQKILGHTDIKTTMIYTDVNLETQRKAFERVNMNICSVIKPSVVGKSDKNNIVNQGVAI